MKKVLVIALIPIFLMATQGVAVTTLFCKGKITKISAGVKPCCKDVNKGGCCKTESRVLKVQDNFTHASVDYKFTADFVYRVSDFSCKVYSISRKIDTTYFRSHAPPLIKQGLYILFRAIII
jgi:hypothetical protein